jgi:hypothetical protein
VYIDDYPGGMNQNSGESQRVGEIENMNRKENMRTVEGLLNASWKNENEQVVL